MSQENVFPPGCSHVSPGQSECDSCNADFQLRTQRPEGVLGNNQHWLFKRTLIGFAEIIESALQTMRGVIPDLDENEEGYDSRLRSIADTIYKFQLSIYSLKQDIENL